MASQPLSVTTKLPPASSLKQIIVFAIICIFINIFMRYLPSFPVEIPSSIFGLLSSLHLKDLKFSGPVDATVPGIESGGDIRSSYK
ncbi:hypothetical protein PAXINDRAFT_22113 [Paxillus involutus ATCC 200175]|uniref:Uncharacterized protein n=1 Tax=Paxillus involutus ATCC 200175 TaxID=664439 RepID=A0A0C9SZM4_PAXIN|nr:hypothetical protein PAXINDRAFT_22113 [Paxillus involutus ATCC 200175]